MLSITKSVISIKHGILSCKSSKKDHTIEKDNLIQATITPPPISF